MVICGLLGGASAAWSSALGSAVNVVAGAVYGGLVALMRQPTAADTIRVVIRAEAVKVGLIVLGLWAALTHYPDIVHWAFILAFIISLIVFQWAMLLQDR